MTITAATIQPPATVLSAMQRRRYEEEGYLVVRGLFSATEIAAVAAEADQLLQRGALMATDNIRCRWQNHIDIGVCLFETFDPVIDLAPVCAALARDRRLLEILVRENVNK